MKNLISSTTIWIAIALVALMSVGTAYAETKLVRVEIPFKFFAGDEVLPAGVYRVVVDPHFNRMELRRIDGTAGAFVSVSTLNRTAPAEAGQLLFRGYGNAHFLESIWGAGRSSGYELPKSKAEREMARAASGGTQIAWVRILTK